MSHSRGDEGGPQKLTQRRNQMVSDIRADLAKHKHVSDKGGEEEIEFRDKNPLIRDLLDKAQERYEKLMTLLEDMDLLPKAKKQQKRKAVPPVAVQDTPLAEAAGPSTSSQGAKSHGGTHDKKKKKT